MGKKEATAEATENTAPETAEAKTGGGGNAIILPNGEKRIDYIRRRYYQDNIERGEIRKEINQMYVDAGKPEGQIAYQIVFAASKMKREDYAKAQQAPAS